MVCSCHNTRAGWRRWPASWVQWCRCDGRCSDAQPRVNAGSKPVGLVLVDKEVVPGGDVPLCRPRLHEVFLWVNPQHASYWVPETTVLRTTPTLPRLEESNGLGFRTKKPTHHAPAEVCCCQ